MISTTIKRLQLPLVMLLVGLCLIAMGFARAPTLSLAGLFYLALGARGLHKMRSRKPVGDGAYGFGWWLWERPPGREAAQQARYSRSGDRSHYQ